MDRRSVLSSRSSTSSCKNLPKRNINKLVPHCDALNFANVPSLKIYPPIHNEEITKRGQEKEIGVKCQIPNVQLKYKELIKRYERAFRQLKEKEEERARLRKIFNEVKRQRNIYQHQSQELNNEYEILVGEKRRRASKL